MLKYYVYHALDEKGAYIYWGDYDSLGEAQRVAYELQDFFADAYIQLYVLILGYPSEQKPLKIIDIVQIISPQGESK